MRTLARFHSQLGRVLAAEGKNDAAIAELEAGIKATPNDEAAQRRSRGTLLDRRKE